MKTTDSTVNLNGQAEGLALEIKSSRAAWLLLIIFLKKKLNSHLIKDNLTKRILTKRTDGTYSGRGTPGEVFGVNFVHLKRRKENWRWKNLKMQICSLRTNILYYIEYILSHFWFYDPVMSLPMWDGVFPLKK